MTPPPRLPAYKSCIWPEGILLIRFKRPFELEPNDPSS